MAADVEWNVSHCAANMMVQLPIDTQALYHIFVWYFFYGDNAPQRMVWPREDRGSLQWCELGQVRNFR